MTSKIVRGIFVALLSLGMAIPGAASADQSGKGCSLQGTWFGVVSPEDTRLTGWMVTVTGKSENDGSNNLEFPIFDPTFDGAFSSAVRISTLRGAWNRTGGNTFIYSFMGFGVDALGAAVYMVRVSGDITLSGDCQSEFITATAEIFLPFMSPFDDDPIDTQDLDDHYGYRAYVDLP